MIVNWLNGCVFDESAKAKASREAKASAKRAAMAKSKATREANAAARQADEAERAALLALWHDAVHVGGWAVEDDSGRVGKVAKKGGAWSGTPIRDTSCCCHPLIGVPYLRPGPRRDCLPTW